MPPTISEETSVAVSREEAALLSSMMEQYIDTDPCRAGNHEHIALWRRLQKAAAGAYARRDPIPIPATPDDCDLEDDEDEEEAA